MDERDIVVFEDEDGNEIELDVVRYFEHEGQEYAVLMNFTESCEEDDDCETCDCCDAEMYLFKIVEDGEFEEFVAVDEDKFDDIAKALEELEEKELAELQAQEEPVNE